MHARLLIDPFSWSLLLTDAVSDGGGMGYKVVCSS